MKVRIVQCLCGPARHCIIAVPYMPGLTAAQKDFGSNDDITLTAENAAEYVKGLVDGLIARKAFNPWCHLCNAKREQWVFEDAQTIFNSIQEAEGPLRQMEQEQARARRFLSKN